MGSFPSFPYFSSLSASTDVTSLTTTLILAFDAHPPIAVASPHCLCISNPCCLSPPLLPPPTLAAPPHSCCIPTPQLLPLAVAACPPHFRLLTHNQGPRPTHPNTRHPPRTARPQADRTRAGVAATARQRGRRPAAGAVGSGEGGAKSGAGHQWRGRRQRWGLRPRAGAAAATGATAAARVAPSGWEAASDAGTGGQRRRQPAARAAQATASAPAAGDAPRGWGGPRRGVVVSGGGGGRRGARRRTLPAAGVGDGPSLRRGAPARCL